ncbi:hypothetical protein ACFX15_012829 [Malus domestica]
MHSNCCRPGTKFLYKAIGWMGSWKKGRYFKQVEKPNLVQVVTQPVAVLENVKVKLYPMMLHPKHIHAKEEFDEVWIKLVRSKSNVS